MEKAREIKRKIDNINEIKKITKAMEMVSSFKILRAQKRILEARPFFEKVEDFINDIACHSRGMDNPLIKPREQENSVLVIGITSDRGLCGAYNANIIRLVESKIEELVSEGKKVKLDIIGTRGIDYFSRRSFELSRTYKYLSEYPKFLDAREISRDIISRYVAGEVDRVIICYTRFVSVVEHKTCTRQVLPVPFSMNGSEGNQAWEEPSVNVYTPDTQDIEDSSKNGVYRVTPEFIYEPSIRDILDSLLPEYIYSIVYIALLESTASEIGARMTAMRSATDNADEIIDELRRRYNRARQQEITLEIAEITSEAEFLKKDFGRFAISRERV